MKYIISLSIIISCLSILGSNNIKKSSINYQINNDTTRITKRPVTGFFKVYEIKKLKMAYIIEVYDSVSRTIVSLKSNSKCSKIDKIKVGNSYKFELTPYFNIDTMPGDLTFPIKINGIEILIRPKGINIYTTSNINGICFIKD